MTSPNAHGREIVLAYSASVIDRAGNQRSDPGWVDATMAADGARLIPMWRDQCIVSGEPPVPAILPVAKAAGVLNAAAETVFLGLDDDRGIFAADLSPARESPEGMPEPRVRAPAFPAGRTRGDYARGEPGHAPEVSASSAQGFGRWLVLDPRGLC
jgi:NADH pyrophosphatase-like rudimentary NUDIX domain